MTSAQQQRLAASAKCEVRFDGLTRQLYATDASIYEIEPLGVAFPRSAAEAKNVMLAAADAGVSVIPRGAGTGLVGGAIGRGLIIDFFRHNRRISDFDRKRKTVRVGAGVVLDQLNAFLKPHGLLFGPDVATSSRATLGGMIANNSSGAHVPVYGTTADHLLSLEVVLADGTVATIGRDGQSLPEQRAATDRIVDSHAAAIAERLPPGLLKRWSGYGFDRYLRTRGDLTQVMAGSEGTLAAITSAELSLISLPARRGLAVLFFASVEDAMQATVELLDLKAAAIEHIDRVLLDQTAGQLAFRAARAVLRLDEEPAEALLLVEFFDHIDEKLGAIANRPIGLRKLICTDEREQALIWSVRKAGLSLLTAMKGAAKPTTAVEDVAVRPEQLPDYVAGLRSILNPLKVDASFYGHAASGLLHVRPVLDLHTADGVAKLRHIGDGVAALVRQFKGSIAAEHGVGIARTEYLAEQLGPELMTATRELKQVFDPRNLLNPGKLVPDGSYRIDGDLRQGAGREIHLPFKPVLAYVERDESFVDHLEQCNGCGGCRKDAPTMCPTFVATGDEIMSTRGRASTIRAVLEHRLAQSDAPLASAELDAALSNCLSCKACKTECPSNVDLALLKAELLHARHERDGVSLLDRMIAAADSLGRLGCATRPIANWALRFAPLRWLMARTLGLAAKRPLPAYAATRFDRWFSCRTVHRSAARGRVILWDDTFVRYHEPEIGIAAVSVLEAAGYEVVLAEGRLCCGRPAFSRGLLDEFARLGGHNIDLLRRMGGDDPIIFLEPSCHSMFIDDYRQLRIPHAESVAARCVSFEQFMVELLDREPGSLRFKADPLRVAIHAHCHAKALSDVGIMPRLARRIPNASVELLDTGCCGMAGAFGMLENKYALSLDVARPLVDKVNAFEPGTRLVASGTSCRHQITHLTDARPLHMAELLAQALLR